MSFGSLQSSLFDTIGGLPVHPLAVHVAVVLLPLSALALGILIFIPKWRKAYLPLTLIGLSIATVFTFIAKESGVALSERVGEPQAHEELGEILFPASLGLLAVGVAFYFLQKSERPKWMIQTAAGVAIAAIVSVSSLTYFVGHTGAEATWGNRIGPIDSSPLPSDLDELEGEFTASEVSAHNTADDCWVIIEGNVYDLSSFIDNHPGGAGALTNLCGKDGTKAFSSEHANELAPADVLASLRIGSLVMEAKPTETPTAKPTTKPKKTPTKEPEEEIEEEVQTPETFTLAQVTQNNSAASCWTIVNGKVYDLTSYVTSHPGGESSISKICGQDGTDLFTNRHGGDPSPMSELEALQIGTLKN